MKKTTEQIIKEAKIKKPEPFIYSVFSTIGNALYYKRCKVDLIRHVEPRDYLDKPVIVICNHISRFDYAFVNFAMRRRRINYIAAENEFHRRKFKFVFKHGRVIPKRQFVSDLTTIKGITRVIKKEKNGCACIFPSGINTPSGAQQPSVAGTGKLLKHFGVHVLVVRVHGSYLVCPKFERDYRFGKVEVELDELFTPEQLKRLSADEIQRKADEALYTDDYEWNATRQNSYNRKDGKYAEHMEQVLYKCPKCGTEMQMIGENDTIYCKHCGNGARLDDKYNLIPFEGSAIPRNPRVWFDWQRREMRKAVVDPDFCMEEHVTLSMQPEYGYVKDNKMGYPVGDGILHLDKNGLSYKGTRNGKIWEVFIKRDLLQSVVMEVDSSFFHTYASGEFLMFTPDSHCAPRWLLAVEEIDRVNDGKWPNFPWFDYDEPLELQ